MILFSTLGSVLSASTSTIGTYFGARVFKTLGNTGTDYVGNVLVADITTLLHREIFLGLNAVPFVFTIWAGPPIAQILLDGSTWRWGYGAYAITTPIVAVPVVYMLFWAQHNAKRAGFETREMGAVVEGSAGKKGIWWQVRYWVIELDGRSNLEPNDDMLTSIVLGLTLLSTGFILTLLAVTLAKSSGSTWRSAHTLVMIILGPLLLVCFAIYERSYAPRPLIPFHLLRDRTVLGACLMSATMRVAYYIWDDYYSSYLQVVHGMSVTHAGYVERVYSLVACLWAPLLGYLISRVGKFKIFALIAVPVHALGAGLLIHFRHRGTHIAWLCFTQGLLGLGGGTLTNTEELAVMAATTHSNVAGILAFKALFSYLGGAVGSAIAGALWLNLFPEKLAARLPAGSEASAARIFASLKTQLSYEMGSPEREAIIQTYSDVQKVMAIASTVIVVLASGLVFIWRDLELKGRRQTPGRVLGAK